MSRFDDRAHDVTQSLLAHGDAEVARLLPGGKAKGREYYCATIDGGEGKSFKVNLDSGKWCEFNGGEGGHNLVTLYAAVNDIERWDALKKLEEELGTAISNALPESKKKKPASLTWGNIRTPKGPPPEDMMGKPAQLYEYKNVKGETVYYKARYERDGRKTFCSFTYTSSGWVKKEPPAPKMLYGLERLTGLKGKVILCEGEKACDAINRHLDKTGHVALSWPNGAGSAGKANWEPLHNRDIIVWPDNDESGIKAGETVIGRLKNYSKRMAVIRPNGQPKGWDAADGDWANRKELGDWIAKHVEVIHDAEAKKTKTVPSLAEASEMWGSTGITTDVRGNPVINEGTARAYIEHSPLADKIWYDGFHAKVLTNWEDEVREWTDADTRKLLDIMQRELALHRFSAGKVHDAICAHAEAHATYEPLDWVKSLEWDERPRVNKFFSHYMGCKDSEYATAVSKNFWLSMLARIHNPGCKVDSMVILEGAQGARKSTSLEVIGGKWYSDINVHMDTKDFLQEIQGKLIVEIGELDAFNKAESSSLKAIVSRRVDRFRPSYGRLVADYPRKCIFVGTTNQKTYLRDETGNRRFFPILCLDIDREKIAEDREQLFAEAYKRLLSGEDWYEVPLKEAVKEQEMRRSTDAWEDIVLEWLNERRVAGQKQVTLKQAAHGALNIDPSKLDTLVSKRLEKAIRLAGWDKTLVPVGENWKRVYVPEGLITEVDDDDEL